MEVRATNSPVFARRLKELRMSDFNRPGATLPGPVKQRSRFSDFGDRLARTFGVHDRTVADEHDWVYDDEVEYEDNGLAPDSWERVEPRFPLAPNGYDRAAVDGRIGELERELSKLRAGVASAGEVTAEIERIGEQTSAILTVAHDQAQEMMREAREQADRCLADAASNAVLITEGAKRKLHALDTDTDAVWHERGRLVEDVRGIATALFTLAEEATERFPAEPDKPGSGEPAGLGVVPDSATEMREPGPGGRAVDPVRAGAMQPPTPPPAGERGPEGIEPTAQETAPFDPFGPGE
jgi:hypothetical protein